VRNPAATIPAWPKEIAVDRAEMCVVFLAVHGLLSDGEKAKVRARMRKAVDKWNATPPVAASPGGRER